MPIDDYAYLAALAAYRDRLQVLAAAKLDHLSNREALARMVIVLPLPRQPRSGPVGKQLLPRLCDMVEAAAAVPSLAPTYFNALVAELLELHRRYDGQLVAPDWAQDASKRQAAESGPISQLPNKRVNLASWAAHEAHWLRICWLTLIHPVKRVQAGMSVVSVYPDWIWRVSKEACANATSVFRQVFDLSAYDPISRPEAEGRLTELLGVDLDGDDFGWWRQLHGFDTHPNESMFDPGAILNAYWWRQVELLRSGQTRPAELLPCVPSRIHSLVRRQITWTTAEADGLVTANLRFSLREAKHLPYLWGDTAVVRVDGVRRRLYVTKVTVPFGAKFRWEFAITGRWIDE